MRAHIRLTLGLALGLAALAAPATLAVTASATQAAQAQSARSGVDFRVAGVRIFSRPDGGATRVGLGYPGQGWDIQGTGYGTAYTCDNGVTTTSWEHGRNIRTGVVGWVPSCNTVIV
ncbi:hypothetical protein ACWCOT_37270 [Nonomuraea bangladeshensis]